MSHSLSTSMLENYLKMSVPEEDENKVQFMSNEELNKLIKEFIIQELKERLEVREILRNGDVILPL